MNRIVIVSIGLGLAALLSLAVVVEAQHEHGHPMIEEEAPAGLPRVPQWAASRFGSVRAKADCLAFTPILRGPGAMRS
jgi:hypothetical protein